MLDLPTGPQGQFQEEDRNRLAYVRIAPGMLLQLLRGEFGAFTVSENQLPADAVVVNACLSDVDGTVRLMLRSRAFAQIEPGTPAPALPDLVIKAERGGQ